VIRALTELKPHESGTIREIRGGGALARRLGALGITPGQKITKISSMSLKGPVTVQVGRSHIALGFGMAGTIFVDTDRE
jgi:ferrous iron transport protein A